jgi:GAF domain-containing protein
VRAGETTGVVAVDAASSARPDSDALENALRPLRPSISGCLALMLTRDETRIVRSLVEIARDLSRELSERELLESALEHAMTMSTAATGSVMLADRSGRLRIRLARGLPDGVIDETVVSKGEGIAGWVFATEEPLLVEDIPARNANRGRRDVRSAVSVPMKDEDGVIGVLNVGSRAYPARLTHIHVDALEVIGRQTAVALRNARAVAESRDLYFDTLRILAEAMERKDPQARGGARRTLELARHLASELGMDAHEARAVEIAALFHDLGMSALGGRDGSRPLSTVEHGIVTMHPVIAAELLEEAPALREVAPIVYHHHERFDGGGYVGGLEGEEIPLGARVLAVVDAYVSMTSTRPYREALSVEDAAASLREGAGEQFDPHVVEVFLEALQTSGDRTWAPRRSD